MHNEIYNNYECGTQVSRPESHSNANRSPVIHIIIFMVSVFNVHIEIRNTNEQFSLLSKY